jgi:ribonuclease HII
MLQLHEQYPHFQFHLHKGYPTPLHLTLLKRYGPLKGIHRFSYRPVQEALNQKVFLI